ncbi:DEDD exonuclease domain-containing protein [Salinibacter altiplanensis]|uniref:DEDD exonuclease domain-containing protein n=1 Tax=Salinibacter altiplanensis TaxID=1803181 RepID=UPI000C9ED329|nr:DEDD exonuclease domain-containing protein [Salinibacter altiplanensis]
MTIADATFVVTDLETTGTTPDDDRIMEVGAVKVQDGTVIDRFQQLVNPQESVPGRITKMTGITTGMVFEAPPVKDVLPDYRAFLGDGILVAHNTSFDVSFLNAELRRIGDETLSNDTLCTVRLARRLLPGLDSKGLGRLAQFYDIDVDGRHRALGDAEATSVVLRRFVSQLAFEHEVETVEALLRFQHQSYQTVREVPGHIESIRDEVLPDVPDAPGVYVMKNSSGTPLYIGKAKRLPDRLRSHFTAVESSGARKRKMLQKVRSVDWTTTDTELEAILLESRRIKAEKPRYNRAQRRYYNRPFLRLDTAHEYPTISWTRRLEADGAEYYGPVRNTEQAEMVVDVVGRFFQLRECDDERLHLGQRCLYADMDRCTVPCETEDPEAYATVVERVQAFLTGQDQRVLDEMQARMQRASDDLKFEKAAELRDTREQLERILEKQRVAAAPVREHHAALVHRAPNRPDRADVILVRFGRFEESIVCPLPLSPEQRTHLRERCRSVFDADTDPPTTFSKRDATEIRLLSHWVYAHREELRAIRWNSGESREGMMAAIESAIPGQVADRPGS